MPYRDLRNDAIRVAIAIAVNRIYADLQQSDQIGKNYYIYTK